MWATFVEPAGYQAGKRSRKAAKEERERKRDAKKGPQTATSEKQLN